MSFTFGHRTLQSLIDLFHVFLCRVIGDRMDEQWERTIWSVKEHSESLCSILDPGCQQTIRIPWQQLWSAPRCPAEGNLHHWASLLGVNVWFGLSWLWILLRELVPLPWLLGHYTDSELHIWGQRRTLLPDARSHKFSATREFPSMTRLSLPPLPCTV